MAYGTYEILLQRALKDAGPGPWDERDLDRVRSTLSTVSAWPLTPNATGTP